MSDGTRGGSNDVTLPLVATDDLTSGTFSGSKAQVVKLGVGAHNAMEEVDATHPLPVSDAGGSLTVDGTVAVSGTVPVSGTFWQATQPVSNVSLPLPTGASTAAKQPALGTAGTPSTDVITVQGVTSMTALKVDGSAVTQPVSGTVTANAGTGTLAVSLASVPSHAVTNAGTFATQAAQSGTWNVANLPGQTAVPARVTSSATSVTLKAASATHLGFRIMNESTAVLYAKYGATASVTDYTVQIAAGGYLEENVYSGRVDGIWVTANGAAQVTPLTA